MNGWKNKLNTFLSDFEYADDIVGVLVCGSYITGNPTSHSDLDVHIILDNSVKYRERGNKIVDGLLIEYFANPPNQILKYFEEDFQEKSLMCQTQFATGKIMLDKTGDTEALKKKAHKMISDFYATEKNDMSELDKYFLWDMLDDLQDAHENQRADFDLLYFTRLNMLLEKYMNVINLPYNCKSIYGNITDSVVREKYLLRELSDETIKSMITNSITATSKDDKMDAYEKLTTKILNQAGGFNIDGFKLKSNIID
ncbi:MAG: nucleotidyltransferase domain-containing protein [Defluviitaleaceae bacterium]|nr:nucleotidyltransferase domain-containing protein [Defluviitaleaceae bacterium]